MNKTIALLIAILIGCGINCFAQGKVSRSKTQTTTTKQTKKQIQKQPQKAKPLTGVINGHEWVDLGLPSGTKWATCNIGANSPEESGDYFAWGDIQAKTNFQTHNCATRDMRDSELRSKRIIDDKNILTNHFDAAHLIWGTKWHMPTKEQCQELIDNCSWIFIENNGVTGFKIIGANDESIFLPASGYMCSNQNFYKYDGFSLIWTSETGSDTGWSAYRLKYSKYDKKTDVTDRYYGASIRPVTK